VLVLAGVVALAGVLLAGLGYAVAATLRGPATPTNTTATATTPTTTTSSASTAPTTLTQTREAIAARPMLATTPADGRPGRAATRTPGTITVPAATATDPLGVPTGFPRTEAGALGQLAAWATTVLGQLSGEYAEDVYSAWARSGGVGPQAWRLTRDVRTFVEAAGSRALLAATPVGAQVKGADGEDWLVGCVLLQLQTFAGTGAPGAEASIAYGYCERLTWDTDRWVIAPGAEPAEPPHTWPGTERAVQAGWRTWVAGR
jgi:hypothetical protein